MSNKKTSGIGQFFHRQNRDERLESVCRICLSMVRIIISAMQEPTVLNLTPTSTELRA
jgi:hypothetical protein